MKTTTIETIQQGFEHMTIDKIAVQLCSLSAAYGENYNEEVTERVIKKSH